MTLGQKAFTEIAGALVARVGNYNTDNISAY